MKILFKKQKKAFVEELNREVVVGERRQYHVRDLNSNYHCAEGIVKKEDLQQNGLLKTDQGKEFTVFDASFIDYYGKIKRLAQMIPLKDIGWIIASTGIDQNSVVLDAGSGSGGVACFLAKYCKEVHSFDIRDDHLEIAKKNKQTLGLKNVEFKNLDITNGFSVKDADLVVLDLPAPWEALKSALAALKQGGFIVSYSPMISQVIDMVKSIKENAVHLRTVELIEREWEINDRKVRPKSKTTIHSGFLTLIRKLT